MLEVIKFAIGILVLALGFPIGSYLAKITREELKSGQIWFNLLIIISVIGTILGLIFGNDALLFGLLFMAIVTSRSLLKTKKKILKVKKTKKR